MKTLTAELDKVSNLAVALKEKQKNDALKFLQMTSGFSCFVGSMDLCEQKSKKAGKIFNCKMFLVLIS